MIKRGDSDSIKEEFTFRAASADTRELAANSCSDKVGLARRKALTVEFGVGAVFSDTEELAPPGAKSCSDEAGLARRSGHEGSHPGKVSKDKLRFGAAFSDTEESVPHDVKGCFSGEAGLARRSGHKRSRLGKVSNVVDSYGERVEGGFSGD